MSLFQTLRDLEERGIDLVEIVGGDRPIRSPDDLRTILGALGGAGDEIQAELLHFLTHRRFPPAEAASLWESIRRHKKRMADRLGRSVSFRVAALDLLSGKGGALRGVRLIAREELEVLLGHINTDEVTALYTRRYFHERLAAELNRARRYGSLLSLLVLDLDDFKRVNDERGHLAGDALLRRIGRMLRENIRASDAACRWGGDEFAILLPETSSSESYSLAERIRTAAIAEARAELDGGAAPDAGRPIRAGVSIGGATFPTDCEEADELMASADRMCLAAKRAGKNCVRMCGEGDRPPAAGGREPPAPPPAAAPRRSAEADRPPRESP